MILGKEFLITPGPDSVYPKKPMPKSHNGKERI